MLEVTLVSLSVKNGMNFTVQWLRKTGTALRKETQVVALGVQRQMLARQEQQVAAQDQQMSQIQYNLLVASADLLMPQIKEGLQTKRLLGVSVLRWNAATTNDTNL
jgi:hypothetical protein